MEDIGFEEQLKQEELQKQKEEEEGGRENYKDKDGVEYEWDEKKKAWFPKVINQHQYYSGLTKPGKVGEILALYQLKSLSLDSKAKLIYVAFFFLQVARFLQIILLLYIILQNI
jgi:hypothetical protein